MTTIKKIAALYIESADAAQKFELDLHSALFESADEKFTALIKADGASHDCELRDIRYSITQGNFNDAKARYAELTK